MTEINKDMKIVDLALWLPKHKTIAISDLHIGYEEALNTRGILIPRHQVKDTLERLGKILAVTGKLDKIIINGDLKHEFGSVNKDEFFGVRDVISLLLKHCRELIILEGNHDKILGYAKREGVKIMQTVLIGEALFAHGDSIIKTPDADGAKTIVIGHAHPAISVSDGIASEKVKCFLVGRWKFKNLIALPSFNLVTEGTDVTTEETLSPYLENMRNFEAFAVPKFNEILYFGKLKNLSKLARD